MLLMHKVTLILLVAGTLAGCLGPSALDYPGGLEVMLRSEWGWTKSENPIPEHAISKITIHHGGVAFSEDRDPAEYLRSLQKWSRSDPGWMDIPYHFAIDLQGKVYEATGTTPRMRQPVLERISIDTLRTVLWCDVLSSSVTLSELPLSVAAHDCTYIPQQVAGV